MPDIINDNGQSANQAPETNSQDGNPSVDPQNIVDQPNPDGQPPEGTSPQPPAEGGQEPGSQPNDGDTPPDPQQDPQQPDLTALREQISALGQDQLLELLPGSVSQSLQAFDELMTLVDNNDPEAMQVMQRAIANAMAGGAPKSVPSGPAGLPDPTPFFMGGQDPAPSQPAYQQPVNGNGAGVTQPVGQQEIPAPKVTDFVPEGVQFNMAEARVNPNSPSGIALQQYNDAMIDWRVERKVNEQWQRHSSRETARSRMSQFNMDVRQAAERFGATEPEVQNFHRNVLNSARMSQDQVMEILYKGYNFDKLVNDIISGRRTLKEIHQIQKKAATNFPAGQPASAATTPSGQVPLNQQAQKQREKMSESDLILNA